MCVADRAGGAQARSLPNSNNTRLLTADTLTRATEANAHLEDLAACVPRTLTSVPGVHIVRSTLRPALACTRTWGENVRTFVQTHQATFAGVRGRACGQLCGQLCGRMYGQGEGGGAAQCRHGI